MELKATDDLSVDLAYRCSGYGTSMADPSSNTHRLSVGANWHF